MIPGFIQNDIIDRDIDLINKPKTHRIGRTFTLRQAQVLFGVFSILIIPIGIIIAESLFREWYAIAPTVFGISIAYNKWLKRSPLFGNITMAVLTAMVPLIILFFSRECLNMLNEPRLYSLIYIYAFLPFAVIIPRELSLDVSDVDGDGKQGAKTLAVLVGVKASRIVVKILVIANIVVALLTSLSLPYLSGTFLIVTIGFIVYLFLFHRCKTRLDYIKAGRFYWGVMLLGLLGATIQTVLSSANY